MLYVCYVWHLRFHILSLIRILCQERTCNLFNMLFYKSPYPLRTSPFIFTLLILCGMQSISYLELKSGQVKETYAITHCTCKNGRCEQVRAWLHAHLPLHNLMLLAPMQRWMFCHGICYQYPYYIKDGLVSCYSIRVYLVCAFKTSFQLPHFSFHFISEV